MQFLRCFAACSATAGGELSPEPSSSEEPSCTPEEELDKPACGPTRVGFAAAASSGSGGRRWATSHETLASAASDLADLIASLPRNDDASSSSSSSHSQQEHPTGCSQQDTWNPAASRRCSVGSGGSGRRPSNAGGASRAGTPDAKPPGRVSTTDALLVQLGQAAAAAMDAPSTTTPASAEAPLACRHSGRLSSGSGSGSSSSGGSSNSNSRAQPVQRATEVLSASARAALLRQVSAALAAGADLGAMLQSVPAAGGYAHKAASRRQLQHQLQQRRRSVQGMRVGVAAAQAHRHRHTWGGAATSCRDSLAREAVVQQQRQVQEQSQEQQQEHEHHEQPPAPAGANDEQQSPAEMALGQQPGVSCRRLSSFGSLSCLGATASTDLLAALSDSEALLLLQSVHGEVQTLATQEEEGEQACGNQQQLEATAAGSLRRYEDHRPLQRPAAQGVAAGSSGSSGSQAAAAKALCAGSNGPLLLHEQQPLMLLTGAEWGADWQPRAGQHEADEAAAAGFGACGPAGDAAAAEAGDGHAGAAAGCAPAGAVLTQRLMTYEHVTTVVWRDSDTAGGEAQLALAPGAESEAAATEAAAAGAPAAVSGAVAAVAAPSGQPVQKARHSKPAAGAAAEEPDGPPARGVPASALSSKTGRTAAAAGGRGAAAQARQAAAAAAAHRSAMAPSPLLSPAAGSAASGRAAGTKTTPASSGSSRAGTGAAPRPRERSSPQVNTPRSGRAPGGARSPARASPTVNMAAAAASGGAAAGRQQPQDSSSSSSCVRRKEEVAQRTPAPAASSPFAAAATAGSGLATSPRRAVVSPRPSAAAARLVTRSDTAPAASSRCRSASPTKNGPRHSGTLVAFGRSLPRPPSPAKLAQQQERREQAAAAAGVERLGKQQRRQPGRAASLPAGAPAAASAAALLQTGPEGGADGHAVPGSPLLLRVPSPAAAVGSSSSGDWGRPCRPSGLLSCPVAADSWSLEAQQHCRHHSCERLFSGGSAATPGAAAAGSVASGLNDILSLVRQLQGNLAGLEGDMQQLSGVLVRPTGQE